MENNPKTFTGNLWQAAEGIYDEIIHHPFNQELAQGILSKERFTFYIQQDALYLTEFARALSIISGRLNHPDLITRFANFSQGAILAEQSLHHYYFDYYNIHPTGKKSPTCQAYTTYLLATVSLESIEEAVAAVLPCFWIYEQVGKHIYTLSPGNSNNPFQAWINTYADEQFAEGVRKAIATTDQLAEQATPALRQAMQNAYVNCSKLEWMFWDSAYKLDAWPV